MALFSVIKIRPSGPLLVYQKHPGPACIRRRRSSLPMLLSSLQVSFSPLLIVLRLNADLVSFAHRRRRQQLLELGDLPSVQSVLFRYDAPSLLPRGLPGRLLLRFSPSHVRRAHRQGEVRVRSPYAGRPCRSAPIPALAPRLTAAGSRGSPNTPIPR